MQNVIWKFPLPTHGKIELSMPYRSWPHHREPAKILHFESDPEGNVCLWASVPHEASADRQGTIHHHERIFWVLYTGDKIPVDARNHIASAKVGPLMLHLFTT